MTLPFSPVSLMFVAPPDSELFAFLQEAHRLVEREPQVLERIDADLDRHGQEKKALRLEDAAWRQARTLGLPTLPWEPARPEAEGLVLEGGRPRTPAYVVFMFLIGRGYHGGFKSAEATTLLLDLARRVAGEGAGLQLLPDGSLPPHGRRGRPASGVLTRRIRSEQAAATRAAAGPCLYWAGRKRRDATSRRSPRLRRRHGQAGACPWHPNERHQSQSSRQVLSNRIWPEAFRMRSG